MNPLSLHKALCDLDFLPSPIFLQLHLESQVSVLETLFLKNLQTLREVMYNVINMGMRMTIGSSCYNGMALVRKFNDVNLLRELLPSARQFIDDWSVAMFNQRRQTKGKA